MLHAAKTAFAHIQPQSFRIRREIQAKPRAVRRKETHPFGNARRYFLRHTDKTDPRFIHSAVKLKRLARKNKTFFSVFSHFRGCKIFIQFGNIHRFDPLNKTIETIISYCFLDVNLYNVIKNFRRFFIAQIKFVKFCFI